MGAAVTATPRDADETLRRAEQTGLRLASIGRIVALGLLGVWLEPVAVYSIPAGY